MLFSTSRGLCMRRCARACLRVALGGGSDRPGCATCAPTLVSSAGPLPAPARRHFFLHATRSPTRFMPLPRDAQEEFSAYNEIDLPSESRIETIRKAGLAAQDWVGIEKVHGTNFGIYLLHEKNVRYAKRSGIMDPNENFFGYHLLGDEFSAQIRIIADLIKQKYGIGYLGRVVMNGELFGAKYEHPLVPKSKKWCTMPNGKKFPIAGVQIQREPFPQYSPELHFFAFDLKYSVTGAEEDFVQLDFDEMTEIFAKVPNLLFARPLVRGTLDQCLAFDVENFMTPLPALLGLGNYPLEHNLAEGIVIRHAKHNTKALAGVSVSTIIKVRSSSFMELKHPNKQRELKETFIDTVRAAALKRTGGEIVAIPAGMMPQMESAANNLLLNNVSEGRLSNVVSKIGRAPLLDGSTTKDDLALLLAKDALKDFLKEVDDVLLNTSLSFRRMLIQNCYYEAVKVVNGRWEGLLEESRQEEAAIDAATAEAMESQQKAADA